MARQSAMKNEKPIPENANGLKGEVEAEYTKAQLKSMAQTLKATEQAIEDEMGNIARSEYSIGTHLIQIRESKLYRAYLDEDHADGFQTFDAYLVFRGEYWRKSKMSLYNYINLASLDKKTADTVGLTIAAKIGAMAKIDETAAEKAAVKAKAMLADGKSHRDALATVVSLAEKVREKAGVHRSPGRSKRVEEAQEAIKKAKRAPADEISEQDHALADWQPLPAEKATSNVYTKIAIVEVAGLRLQVRSSNSRVDVKVVVVKE